MRRGAKVRGACDDGVDDRKANAAATTIAAGAQIFGKRFGPVANGATPLLSSAMTKTKSTKIAPE